MKKTIITITIAALAFVGVCAMAGTLNKQKSIIKAQSELLQLIHEAWGERRPIPKDIADKLYDLMEEYGEDYDLGENWWLNEGDIEEVYITGTDNN